MRHSTLSSMLAAVIICAAPLMVAAAKVGQAAPDFTAKTSTATKPCWIAPESNSLPAGSTSAAPSTASAGAVTLSTGTAGVELKRSRVTSGRA